MTDEEFRKLQPGDLVRHAQGNGEAYLVTDNHGIRVMAIRTISMTNPREWILASKAQRGEGR